jgi:hypothetical protein
MPGAGVYVVVKEWLWAASHEANSEDIDKESVALLVAVAGADALIICGFTDDNLGAIDTT